MSSAQPPGPAPSPRPERVEPKQEEGFPWRLALLGALVLYGVILVLVNSDQVRVSFVFFSTRVSLIVLILLSLAIGFLAGFLFDTLRERRKKAKRKTS